MKIVKLISFVAILLLVACTSNENRKTRNTENEKKINKLIDQMTLNEKIGQMVQMHNGENEIKTEKADAIRKGFVGSFLNAGDLETKKELQRIAVEESRMKIPLIFGRDVIHGYKTIFPIPLAQSCTWNPELVKKGAEVAAKEAATNGIHWTFAPMIDITRDPRWGRIAETTGEDPFLTSIYAKAMIEGFQGEDVSQPGNVAACAKHFVGYGASEGGKDYNTTLIPETELRNVYLPPFKVAAETGVLTYMSAFNDLNGVPTSGNHYTLTEILRNEWGFQGFVVSDWASVEQLIPHGYAVDKKDAAYKATYAGVDMEMVTTCYIDSLKVLVQEGTLSEDIIDERVRNILRVKIELGLFENPYKHIKAEGNLLTEKNFEMSQQAAEESFVLLKNENKVLPLSEDINKVAIIGPMANERYDQLGTWVLDGERKNTITPLQTFKEELGEEKIIYTRGLAKSRTMEKKLFPLAIDAAKQSDVVVFFGGEESILSGEAHCRTFLNLPGAQEELLKELEKTGKPIILVVMAGRPLILESTIKNIPAVLYAWHPGSMGGPAIYNTLFGKSVPSGKLTTSFPRTEGQIPVYYNHRNTGRPPVEGNYGIPTGTPLDPVGFTANYLDCSVAPAYPFGYGLSYTKFEYSDLKLSTSSITLGQNLEVSVKVTNVGEYDGMEIVQLYTQDIVGRITRPVKELKGFEKVGIAKGESKVITFSLHTDDLAYWDNKKVYQADPGHFKVFVGTNSDDVLVGEFELIE